MYIPHINYFNTVSVCIVPPSIENSTENEIRDQTENVTFLCQAVGEPVPDISWYFNGDMINLSNNSKYNISLMALNESVIESTLDIINVESSDVGLYTCEAENIIGKDQSSGVLTVNGKCSLHA